MIDRASPVKILCIESHPGEVAVFQQTLQESASTLPFFQSLPEKGFSFISIPQVQPVLDALLAHAFDIICLGHPSDRPQLLDTVIELRRRLPHIPLVLFDRHDHPTPPDQETLMLLGIEYYWNGVSWEQWSSTLALSTPPLAIAPPTAKGESPAPVGFLRQPSPDDLLKTVSDAVILVNLQGQIQYLNPAAERLTGWLTEMALGAMFEDVFQVAENTGHESIQHLLQCTLAGQNAAKAAGLIVLSQRDQYSRAVDLSVSPLIAPPDPKSPQSSALAPIQGAIVVCREVTPTRRLAKQLVWQVSHDSLTGLLNRSEFEFYLEKAAKHAQLTQETHILCYFDLDQFKIVNDVCGHSTGDELLRQVSACLKGHVEETDILARLGGDEFGLLLHNRSLEDGRQRVQTILDSIQQLKFWHLDRCFQVSLSTGIVVIDHTAANKTILLSAADTALYMAKDRGRNRWHVYQVGDQELERRQGAMQWVSRLTRALGENRFCLYLQSIASLREGPEPVTQIYEILLRLRDREGQLVMPGAFIPAAEHYNFMPALDRWVIQTLFQFLSQFPRQVLPDFTYNINLSGASFNDEQFSDFVKQQFQLYGIAPRQICFEITETAAIANLSKAVDLMQELRSLGCHFALDDFGSGMSSLKYLSTLPVDYLKIDGQLIRPIAHDPVSTAMIEAIVHISSAMNLRTVAEFVENSMILQKVKDLGIDYAQGYAISHPFPLTDLHPLLAPKIS